MSLALLAALGLICWLVVRPVLQTRATVHSVAFGKLTGPAAVERLGGPEHAAARIALYCRLPKRVAPQRLIAVGLLACCGTPAVPTLVRVFDDPEEFWTERVTAADSLGYIGPQADAAVPSLKAALGDGNPRLRVAAAAALARIKPGDGEALKALVADLAGQDANVRFWAAEGLGCRGAGSPQVVAALIGALKDGSETVRGAAARALGRIGPDARDAIPALEETLGDRQTWVGNYAAEALAKIRGGTGGP